MPRQEWAGPADTWPHAETKGAGEMNVVVSIRTGADQLQRTVDSTTTTGALLDEAGHSGRDVVARTCREQRQQRPPGRPRVSAC